MKNSSKHTAKKQKTVVQIPSDCWYSIIAFLSKRELPTLFCLSREHYDLFNSPSYIRVMHWSFKDNVIDHFKNVPDHIVKNIRLLKFEQIDDFIEWESDDAIEEHYPLRAPNQHYVFCLLKEPLSEITELQLHECDIPFIPTFKSLQKLEITNSQFIGHDSCPINEFMILNEFMIDYHTLSKCSLVDNAKFLEHPLSNNQPTPWIMVNLESLIIKKRPIKITLYWDGIGRNVKFMMLYYLDFIVFASKYDHVNLCVDFRIVLGICKIIPYGSYVQQFAELLKINWYSKNRTLINKNGSPETLKRSGLDSNGILSKDFLSDIWNCSTNH
jgi:hypothetical protein